MINTVKIASKLLQEDLTLWMGKASRRLAMVTDTNVAPLYAEGLAMRLRDRGYQVKIFTFPAGEKYKTRRTIYSLQDQILDWGIDRDAAIVGVGGGVVTDIAGYTAASLLRGIEFISIPTSLLAMVDASVGGKTGVNTRHGKNLIGAFFLATSVLIDPKVLKTLPKEQFLEGVVEMIKHGAISDHTYFQELVDNADKMLRLDDDILENAIAKSVEIKAAIVAEDVQERKGKRCILNFGHTLGHALELASHYEISHGSAVAIGMVAETELAVHMGRTSPESKEALVAALRKYGLETLIPTRFSEKTLLQAMEYDKKNKNRKPRFVLINAIGSCDPCGGGYCSEVKKEALDALFVNKAHE